MAQVVEPNLWQTSCFEQILEIPKQVAIIQWSTELGSKEQAVLLPILYGNFSLGELTHPGH